VALIQPAIRIPGAELADWVARADCAILPLGALEWHGEHMPLGTDILLAEAFAERLPGDLTGVLYPTMPYSACPGKTQGYPGTTWIRPDVALNYLCDILDGILRAGFRRVLLLNAHDANMSIARAAMEWATGRHQASLLLVNWFQLLTPAETSHLFAGHNGRGHGGPYEMAATWSVAPDTVRPEAARPLPPRPALQTDRQHVLVESSPSPWRGYSGLLEQASQAKGDWIIEQALARLGALLYAWLQAPPSDPPRDPHAPADVL
jgi:creatinine amidohydrolase